MAGLIADRPSRTVHQAGAARLTGAGRNPAAARRASSVPDGRRRAARGYHRPSRPRTRHGDQTQAGTPADSAATRRVGPRGALQQAQQQVQQVQQVQQAQQDSRTAGQQVQRPLAAHRDDDSPTRRRSSSPGRRPAATARPASCSARRAFRARRAGLTHTARGPPGGARFARFATAVPELWRRRADGQVAGQLWLANSAARPAHGRAAAGARAWVLTVHYSSSTIVGPHLVFIDSSSRRAPRCRCRPAGPLLRVSCGSSPAGLLRVLSTGVS
jgi:hypothetical protein